MKGEGLKWNATRWGIEGLLERCGGRRLQKCKNEGKDGDRKVHPRFEGWVRHHDQLEPMNTTKYAADHKVDLNTLADLVRLQQRGSWHRKPPCVTFFTVATAGHRIYLHRAIADISCHEILEHTLVPWIFRLDYTVQMPLEISETHTHRCSGSTNTFATTPMLDMGPKGSPHPAHVEKGAHRIWIAPIEVRVASLLATCDLNYM